MNDENIHKIYQSKFPTQSKGKNTFLNSMFPGKPSHKRKGEKKHSNVIEIFTQPRFSH